VASTVMDRNFPGVPRIKAMLHAGTHVLIRVRDGITLPRSMRPAPWTGTARTILATGAR